ncbi:TetR/AcrR family transcriptional regulator [Psychromarinibacter sp. S121]|uniref:TetR/AcrR family transcriptional regulator n=1 Tax=Psychromarinibacter sp. S121 TaxID=3415127 RepID=UPI003C7D4D53
MTVMGDHRSRVAEQRRVKMRRRLIEAATRVFARQGPEGTVIEHVIEEAGVARGTFYNHFRSIDALLEAAKNELGCEIIQLASSSAKKYSGDARAQMVQGLKGFIDVARRYPLFLEFLSRLGMRGAGPGSYVREVTPKYLEEGVKAGLFRPIPPQIAIDILESSSLALLRRLHKGGEVDVDAFVAAMLRAMGVDPDDAERLAAVPLDKLDVPEDSMIAQSDALRSVG